MTRPSIEQWAAASVLASIVGAILAPVGAALAAPLGVGTVLVCLAAVPSIASRMPLALRGAVKRRLWLSALWMMLGLVAVAQVARLSAFMVDSSRIWGSTVPDAAAAEHQCMSAYVYAADLARRHEENIYAEHWYPAFTWQPGDRSNGVTSPVRGLARWVSDPYEYPPPFLLLPRAALALTSSFDHIRTGWFVLQALLFVLCALALARWIGGREGLITALLLPAVLASFPMMLNFQFGQFHAMAVVLALAAMIAFGEGRTALGGSLLAAATLSKLFPGLLLVTLASERRWRAVAWTCGFVALFSLIGLVVLGPDPFVDFTTYQLPRMASGQAFSFAERDVVPTFIVSRNFSIYGIVAKLRLLGLSSLTREAAVGITWIYTFLLLWLAWRVGARSPSRAARVLNWLALLNLAALRSPVAPSAYVVAPMLWLLAILASEVRSRWSVGLALGLAWALIMGPPPLPDVADLTIGLIGQMLMISLCVWIVSRRSTRPLAPAPVATGVRL